MKRKAIYLILFLSLVSSFTFGDEKSFSIGVKTGYSLGLDDQYKKIRSDFYGGYQIEYAQLGRQFGIYGQLTFSHHFSLQVEYDYQKRTGFKEFHYYRDPKYVESYSGDESYKLVYISGIYYLLGSEAKKIIPYISLGYGARLFPSGGFVRIGGGAKYRLFGHSFINANILTHVLSLYLYPLGFEYLSFNIGFEQEF